MSEANGILGWQIARAIGEPCVDEYRFHPERRWRFDFAFPAKMVAVEVDGGSWIAGRHTSGVGFYNDCEKMSVAAAMGWRVLRVTPKQIEEGKALAWIEMALAYHPLDEALSRGEV